MTVADPFHSRTNGHAALYAPETPSGASQPQPEDDLARVLSPTQVNTFLDCSAKWWFKHAIRLPERKSSNLGIGIAFHEAVMENFRQKGRYEGGPADDRCPDAVPGIMG